MVEIIEIKSWIKEKSWMQIFSTMLALLFLVTRSLFDGFLDWVATLILTVVLSEGPSESQVVLIGGKLSVMFGLSAVIFLSFVFRKEIWSLINSFRRRKTNIGLTISWICVLLPGLAFYFAGINTLMVNRLSIIIAGVITTLLLEIAFINILLSLADLFGYAKKSVAAFLLVFYILTVLPLAGLVQAAGEFDYLKYAEMLIGADYGYLFRAQVLIPAIIYFGLTGLALMVMLKNEFPPAEKQFFSRKKSPLSRLILTVLSAVTILSIKPVLLIGDAVVLPQKSISTSLMEIESGNVESLIGGHIPKLITDYFTEEVYQKYEVLPAEFQTVADEYQLFETKTLVTDSLDKKPQHFKRIILLTVESFSLDFTGYENQPCDETVTPFVDSLMSVYPSGGLWTSAAPTLYGLSATFSSHPNANLVIEEGYPNSFVKALSENGYRTPFIRSAPERYANEHVLFKQAGFSEMYGREYYESQPEYAGHVSGWGLEDAYLFKDVVSYLKKHRNDQVFMHVMPADTHSPFGREEYSDSYPSWPADLSCKIDNELLLRSFYWQDYDLKRFYKAFIEANLLDDETLLIITGDHSAPRVYSPEPEILSKVPVIFISKNIIESLNLANQNNSQVDLAPTILDFSGIRPPAGYFGNSLLNDQIRPYLGVHGGYITIREDSTVRKVSMDRPAGQGDKILVEILNSIIVNE